MTDKGVEGRGKEAIPGERVTLREWFILKANVEDGDDN